VASFLIATVNTSLCSDFVILSLTRNNSKQSWESTTEFMHRSNSSCPKARGIEAPPKAFLWRLLSCSNNCENMQKYTVHNSLGHPRTGKCLVSFQLSCYTIQGVLSNRTGVPKLGYICLSERVHLRLAREGKLCLYIIHFKLFIYMNLSEPFHVTNGVRPGGVLRPYFFAV